ncbi:MAG: SppA protein [Candidatus Thiodiazotropha sp. (ex Ctena orbiculata)]|nr:SppA protein [Candidatus Thiodiazotropha taylori]
MKENLREDYDYILYFGRISLDSYNRLSDTLEIKQQESNNTKGYFIPVTVGGHPDSAYRMARALGHHYPDDLKVLVPDICKSAGTLIAIGATELVISDRGELGPLDVQLQKKEELFEMSSGLDIIQSMVVLQEQVMEAFRSYLMEIKLGSGLGTKIASKLASEMASALVSPISSQIDPMRIGEHQRALRVATWYGTRLNKKFNNTNDENIYNLITGYPSHGFVIDRKEASEIFKNVRALDDKELAIEKWLRKQTANFNNLADGDAVVICLNDWLDKTPKQKTSGEVNNDEEIAEHDSESTEEVVENTGEPVSENQERPAGNTEHS